MRKTRTYRRGRRVRIDMDDRRLIGITPQARTVLRHLSDTGTITQREALLDHSVQSLTRRITELRNAGYEINGVWRYHPVTGQRYMRYSLVG